MIVSAKALHEVAYKKFSIGAFNVHNMEQLLGVFEGCSLSKAPFILQVFPSTRTYANKRIFESMIREAELHYPDLIFAVNLDHGSESSCLEAISSGLYSSVMIDASLESFEKNIEISRRVADHAHANGVSVEAMLGRLGGKEEHMHVLNETEVTLTDPGHVKEFVSRTNCDSLAVSVGNLHGIRKSFETPRHIDFDLLAQIAAAVPAMPLVMHGSSAIRYDDRARVEELGGSLSSAFGMDEQEQAQLYKYGVTQINVNSDSLLLWTRVHREHFNENPESIDLREPGKKYMDELRSFVMHKNQLFGSEGMLALF